MSNLFSNLSITELDNQGIGSFKLFPSRIQLAENFIEKMSKCNLIFVVGKAGVGKTFFVKYISNMLRDKHSFVWLDAFMIDVNTENVLADDQTIYVIDYFYSIAKEAQLKLIEISLMLSQAKLIIISRGNVSLDLPDHYVERISGRSFTFELHGMAISDTEWLLNEYKNKNLDKKDIKKLINLFNGNPHSIFMCLESNIFADFNLKKMLDSYKGDYLDFSTEESFELQILKITAHQKYQQGKYDESITLFKQLLEQYLKETSSSSDIMNIVTTYNNIANVYQVMSCFEDALQCYQTSLELCEKYKIQDSPIIATIYNNIGGIYSARNEILEAEEYYYKSLALREKTQGDELEIANSYSNIASVNFQLNDFDKAFEWYKKALDIRAPLLGAEHPLIATTYNNIGSVYESMGMDENAMEFYKKALSIYEKILGQEHPDTAITYNNIAFLYFSEHDYTNALNWYGKAYKVFKGKLGEKHPYTSATHVNLIDTFMRNTPDKSFDEWFNETYNS